MVSVNPASATTITTPGRIRRRDAELSAASEPKTCVSNCENNFIGQVKLNTWTPCTEEITFVDTHVIRDVGKTSNDVIARPTPRLQS
jgi:hypothetical protein